MQARVNGSKVWLGFGLLLGTLLPISSSATQDIPDVALLEFIGNTAGLEALGVNLDQMLQSPPQTTTKPPSKPSMPPNSVTVNKSDENN